MESRRLLGGVQVLLAGLCFGFLGIFGKLAFASGLKVGEILAWRFLTAALILFTVLILFRRRLLRIDRHQLVICACLGVFGYNIFATFYFKAIEGVSASLAALLLYTFPALVTVGAWVWLKETIANRQKLAIAIAAVGCAALVWGEITLTSWTAVVYGLLSALTYAIYILASRRWQKEIEPITSGFYVILFAGIALFVWHQPSISAFSNFSSSQYGYIAGLAVISTILPMILFLSGLQKLKGAEASVLSTIEPVAATVLSVLIFKEELGLSHILGGASILLSVLLTVSPTQKTKSDA